MKKLGIDTCIVLRLLVGKPADQAETSFLFLEKCYLSGTIVYVSDLVIAEVYHVLCHHYNVPFFEAAKKLTDFLASPMITLSGHALTVLKEYQGTGAGFVDRLILKDLLDYANEIFTFDKKFSKLSCVTILDKSCQSDS
ncbi:MAG: PIN domain-containing protein [Desulfobacterales bacterium]|nr:PIN domain-containing protein [Desulfobacterales bacterium]